MLTRATRRRLEILDLTLTTLGKQGSLKLNVRIRGLLKVIGSGIGFAIVFATVLKSSLGDPSHGGPFKLIAMGLPGAFAIAGLIELVSGSEFQKLSGAWDGLESWQRGIFGIVVVLLSFSLVIACVGLFG